MKRPFSFLLFLAFTSVCFGCDDSSTAPANDTLSDTTIPIPSDSAQINIAQDLSATERDNLTKDASDTNTQRESEKSPDGKTSPDTPQSTDTDSPSAKPSPRFTQAMAGSMWVNPTLNPEIPIHIKDAADALTVTVTLNGEAYVAETGQNPGTWIAIANIASLPPGIHSLVALVEWEDETRQASANLHAGTEGVQFTDFEIKGPASTPRLHLKDEQMWITWVDRSGGKGRAWLQAVSGSGKNTGAPIGLTPEHIDITEGRAILGNVNIGLLYRVAGAPERNWFTIVDFKGVMKQIPVQLELGADKGEWGGDLSFDGEAFQIFWRSRNATAARSEIRGMRIEEEPISLGEPFVIASEGDSEPMGAFPDTLFLRGESIGDLSIVTYSQDALNPLLDMEILTNRATLLQNEGTILYDDTLPTGIPMPFSYQAHVHKVQDEFLLLWVAADINESDDLSPNQPQRIYGARIKDSEPMSPAALTPTQILKAPHARGEVVAIGHPHHYAFLAWTDERSHAEGEEAGSIDLRYQPIDKNLNLAETTPLGSSSLKVTEQIIPHARFIADSAQVNGVALGSNIFLAWIDERHGGTLANSKPEVYFETIWY